MSCRAVTIGGVGAILCTRGVAPPRVHMLPAGQAATLCGRTAVAKMTSEPYKVTCKKCRAWIRRGVLGFGVARAIDGDA